ncbi:MAG: hypothetical protein L0G52_05035 [Brachybacterium sp.]|nr:hypothetical protein [Brachybacterium sp.]MDN5606066.1 hypothetical protein [Kocuria sp.]
MSAFIRLAELAVPGGFVGGPFGSNLVSNDYVPDGIPVIRGSNMGRDGRLQGPFAFVTEEKFHSDLSRNTAVAGDLIFTQRGTLGQVVRVDNDDTRTYVISQSQMRMRLDSTLCNPRFVQMACGADGFLSQVNSHAIRSGVPHINLAILKELTIPDLYRGLQDRIVEVLGALEDKIDANRNIGILSDEAIRASYARLPMSPSVLGDIAENVRIGVSAEEVARDEVYVGLEHVGRKILWLQKHGSGVDVASGKFEFAAGDTLFGRLRPYFHKVAIAPGRGVCSTDILVIRPRMSENAMLTAAAASSEAVVTTAVRASNGTKMPRAKWIDVAASSIPDPMSTAVREFCDVAESIARRAISATEENSCLAATRDELLPLLMSGKITVKDAEKTVEEVV